MMPLWHATATPSKKIRRASSKLDSTLIVGPLLGIAVVVFLLLIRSKDLPAPVPVSPFQHLDDRKAIIYENLRDLQFEYRLDKLSDSDYQATKLELQKDLAVVMAETVDGDSCPAHSSRFRR